MEHMCSSASTDVARQITHIQSCRVFFPKEYYYWDAYSVYAYGSDKVFTENIDLVNDEFVALYPAIIVGNVGQYDAN